MLTDWIHCSANVLLSDLGLWFSFTPSFPCIFCQYVHEFDIFKMDYALGRAYCQSMPFLCILCEFSVSLRLCGVAYFYFKCALCFILWCLNVLYYVLCRYVCFFFSLQTALTDLKQGYWLIHTDSHLLNALDITGNQEKGSTFKLYHSWPCSKLCHRSNTFNY